MKLLQYFITLPELCRRWQCDFHLIHPYTERQLNYRGFPDLPPQLQLYKIQSLRECPKGQVKACVGDPVFLPCGIFDDDYFSWDDKCINQYEIAFDIDEIKKIETENPALLCSPVPFNDIDTRQENNRLQERVTELETELAACREQLEKARVENPSPNTKTSTATQVRLEKSLADWKDAFKVMVPVILQCQKEGPKPRTTPELEKMCARYNSTLDKSKMAFLRECLKECLGPEHVNTTGGPTIQG